MIAKLTAGEITFLLLVAILCAASVLHAFAAAVRRPAPPGKDGEPE